MTRIDVSDYLLGELPPEDVLEAERLMREDPEFREQVERLRPVVARLDDLPPAAWEPLEPPPLRAPQEAGGREPASERRAGLLDRLRGNFVLRPAVAAVCALGLIAAGVGAGLAIDGEGGGGGSAPVDRFVMAPFGEGNFSASGVALVSEAEDGSTADVRVAGLRPSSSGDFYELWLLDDPEEPTRLISLGSFRVPRSGEAMVDVPLPVDPERFFFDLSVEAVDGDPAHSGNSVLRAPA
jgi:anti-sigma-K factor RskA